MHLGIIGLAVMGQNLAKNFADRGVRVAVFNRSPEKTRVTVGEDPRLAGFEELRAFVAALERPRKILLMVQAGTAVDQTIESLVPFLSAGDLILDGGNSYFVDTERRAHALHPMGIGYMGVGVSGGEDGARHGPSMMPGGDGWADVGALLQSVAAVAEGESCCAWMGRGGAGHFVKMVHNGIEYADMQLITELFAIMEAYGRSHHEIADALDAWNVESSYLIEITAKILRTQNVDAILDVAEQKGTGKWTVSVGMDLGVPVTMISEAVQARLLSCMRAERSVLAHPKPHPTADKKTMLGALQRAYPLARLLAYTQGFLLMRRAEEVHRWGLSLPTIAKVWRNGCILRSQFLNALVEPLSQNVPTLLHHAPFTEWAQRDREALQESVHLAHRAHQAAPLFSAALAFLDGITSDLLPTRLIQAQRHYFGSHGVQAFHSR